MDHGCGTQPWEAGDGEEGTLVDGKRQEKGVGEQRKREGSRCDGKVGNHVVVV